MNCKKYLPSLLNLLEISLNKYSHIQKRKLNIVLTYSNFNTDYRANISHFLFIWKIKQSTLNVRIINIKKKIIWKHHCIK